MARRYNFGSVTASAAEDKTLKSAPGRLYSFISSVSVTLKDGSTQVWGSGTSFTGPPEGVEMSSIVFTFSGVGTAYAVYE